jgi:hypothetical protein
MYVITRNNPKRPCHDAPGKLHKIVGQCLMYQSTRLGSSPTLLCMHSSLLPSNRRGREKQNYLKQDTLRGLLLSSPLIECAPSIMLVRIVSPRFFASYSSSKPLVKNGATPTARNASVQHCFARHTLLSGRTSSQRPIENLGTESSMVFSRN